MKTVLLEIFVLAQLLNFDKELVSFYSPDWILLKLLQFDYPVFSQTLLQLQENSASSV